jgi:hypothetical protein
VESHLKTSKGLFEPTVMFFGLMNSLATFQTMMDDIFQEELAVGWMYPAEEEEEEVKKFLLIYMDDILVYMIVKNPDKPTA